MMASIRVRKTVGNARALGLGLLELLLVLAFMAMLMVISYPKLANQYQAIKFSTQGDKLLNLMQVAKLTALLESKAVTVCPTLDAQRCNGNWHQPVMAFIDRNKDGIVNGADKVISQIEGSVWLSSNRTSYHFSLVYLAATTAGTLTLCAKQMQPMQSKAIIVSNVGRLRVEQGYGNDAC